MEKKNNKKLTELLMEKESIKKIALALALLETLSLSGCKKDSNKTEELYYTGSINDIIIDHGTNPENFWYDEEGRLCTSVELAPIKVTKKEPVTSLKIVDGKEEEVTTYHEVTYYFAPSIATRVEGSGADMRCFIDYAYEVPEEYSSLKLNK